MQDINSSMGSTGLPLNTNEAYPSQPQLLSEELNSGFQKAGVDLEEQKDMSIILSPDETLQLAQVKISPRKPTRQFNMPTVASN